VEAAEKLTEYYICLLKFLKIFPSPLFSLIQKSSQWKARSWIQYHLSRECPHALYEGRKDTRESDVVSMTFRAIIPARIRKTDATNERFSERINRERLSVFMARRLHAPLFLFLTYKKRGHRREVTYGIAYYTGIIPAGAYLGFLSV